MQSLEQILDIAANTKIIVNIPVFRGDFLK